MTSAPSSPSAIFSAHSSAKSPETARKTTSHARAASSENSSISSSPKGVDCFLPADRAEAKSFSSSTGKPRWPSTSMISTPTAPVTPTTPTLSGLSAVSMRHSCVERRCSADGSAAMAPTPDVAAGRLCTALAALE